jgi:hypothetical protein
MRYGGTPLHKASPILLNVSFFHGPMEAAVNLRIIANDTGHRIVTTYSAAFERHASETT